MAFPGDSKGLCVLLAFQHEIGAFTAPADKRSLATASPWLQRVDQMHKRNCSTAGAPTAFPGDEELQTLTRRIHAQLVDDFRRNGITKGSKKKPKKRLTAVQVRLLLRDLLVVGSGLRASCLVDCCAMSTELAEFLLGSIAVEDELWGRYFGVYNVRAVVLDGNVFFVNVTVFIREKMLELATEFRHLLYVDASASLALPRAIRRDSDTATSALRLDSAAQWVLRACKGLLVALANPIRRVLAWRKPAMLNATAVAGLLLCYPCVYDIIADAAEGAEDLDSAWSDQENCLALCPLFVVQTAIIPPTQTSMVLQEFSVPEHLLRLDPSSQSSNDAATSDRRMVRVLRASCLAKLQCAIDRSLWESTIQLHVHVSVRSLPRVAL